MPKPDNRYITINDNRRLIIKMLNELVLTPRITALNWSRLTKQTPNMKIGYPAQHLASLITGVEGVRTGARGDDLADGTEIKSCSRVDQVDKCKECKGKVLRIENICPDCGSRNIKRMNDSKWLFTIKSEEELDLLTNRIKRVLLTIADYPFFDDGDFETLRFQVFEIWNDDQRHKNFTVLMSNYYYKIFLEHIKRNANKTPAPKNFWPYSYQFYLCNPVKVFEAIVKDANNEPTVNITTYVESNIDRSEIASELMPTEILNLEELKLLARPENKRLIQSLMTDKYDIDDFRQLTNKDKIDKGSLKKMLPLLDEGARSLLPLRDTDKPSEAKEKYRRR